MISFNEAKSLLLQQVNSLGSETVPLALSHGRVLARDVCSAIALPPFTSSAMDGYACACDGPAPVELRCIGTIAAGDPLPEQPLGQGECWEIMTGAAVPTDCDRVVPVENTDAQGDMIRIHELSKQFSNIRNQGEELPRGAVLLKAGRCLSATDIGLLAGAGLHQVEVTRKVKVVLLTTGSELLCDLEQPLAPGQIYNSNSFYLQACLRELGCELLMADSIQDEPVAAREILDRALAMEPDLLLTTGAVSAGRFDFVPALLKELQAEVLFHKVAVRPGKPILVAKAPRGSWVVSLPGNPVAAMTGLRFIGGTLLRSLMGLPEEKAVRVPLLNRADSKEGMVSFKKARLEINDQGQARVVILPGQSPAQLSPLREANGWAMVEADDAKLQAGQLVSFYPRVWSDCQGESRFVP
ncbi:molybdopterin molybdotransferase MoeA [Dongshaea marina]|uniref:molybdopterin molybdotransferase MoeA n=1 Tax=Dongshaea marina TaxID=2047966 RepID=UPI000D3E84D9|nr:gephyrin-like molybdotransferase Glp [Dongshaea marina]